MLVLDAVGKTYPNGVHALERFSADINLGEIVAIIGGSGCGKSTLLRAISGLDCATTGAVMLDDIAISAPHAKIGIIFQEPRLLPWLNVADNIGFGLSELPADVRRAKVERALVRVGLTDKAHAWPRELPADKRSALRSHARWCRSRKCCCWTSLSPHSTPSPEGICRITCLISGRTRGRPWCWLPTMSMKPSSSPTACW
jgi:ABC-type sugar transport system ATPase subunit